MLSKHTEYLAIKVLNESSVVTYRSLGRALKVHCNAAKEMLYDFYTSQNARKPSSVHATYLLTGLRKEDDYAQPINTLPSQDDDSFMQDVGFMSSADFATPAAQAPPDANVPIISITLVAEENLEDLKSLYKTITSIHIYSLEPTKLINIELISDCNRKIAAEHVADDLMVTWKQYGTIHDPNAKRRKLRAPPPPAAKIPTTAAAKPLAKPSTTTTTTKVSEAAKASTTKQSTASKSTTSNAAPPAALKRESSSLFKSFAKTKAPTKAASPAVEDSDMSDVAAPAPAAPAAPRKKSEREIAADKAREEKDRQLREMMELDDEPAPTVPVADVDAEDVEMEDADDAALDAPPPAQPDVAPQTTVSDGRRRGRRRVMKTRTVKDAEGYLVTKEEAAWESFSEAEEVGSGPAAKRVKIAATTTTTGGAKGKPAAKKAGGQAGIMAFFGKKG